MRGWVALLIGGARAVVTMASKWAMSGRKGVDAAIPVGGA